ncbi:hypothetical protein D3C72_2331490 [compost metagenome]
MQQLVGVQAALHQQLGVAGAHGFDRALGRGMAVRGVDDPGVAQRKSMFGGNLPDARGGPDQDRYDQAQLRGLERAAQR